MQIIIVQQVAAALVLLGLFSHVCLASARLVLLEAPAGLVDGPAGSVTLSSALVGCLD